jgi:lipopolysaccharide/colanic/teichoic acid biosynthesis glycosyltransferase
MRDHIHQQLGRAKHAAMTRHRPRKQIATHLLSDPSLYLTPIGGYLRRTSFDESPQLLSILAGDLNFVGPRPALFNQHDLVALRTERGIHELAPGLTGWAQVHAVTNCRSRPKCSSIMNISNDDLFSSTAALFA